MTTTTATVPDLAAVKARQQQTWASGDFSVVATRILYQAEQLCETAELQAGWRAPWAEAPVSADNGFDR